MVNIHTFNCRISIKEIKKKTVSDLGHTRFTKKKLKNLRKSKKKKKKRKRKKKYTFLHADRRV